jgi:hypothetical protein
MITGTVTMNDYGTLDSSYTITLDTGTDSTITLTDPNDTDTISIDDLSWDFGNKIDPERVEKMCEQYPALRKAWDKFHSIYKMVDQDYKGNYEYDDEIPF